MGQAGIYVGIDVMQIGQGGRCQSPAHGRLRSGLGSPRRSRNPAVGFRDEDPRIRHWCCWRLRAAWNYRWWLLMAAEALPVVVVNPRQVRDFARRYWEVGPDRRPGRPTRAGPALSEAIQPPVRPLRDAETQELELPHCPEAAGDDDSWSRSRYRLGAATSAVRPRIAGPGSPGWSRI